MATDLALPTQSLVDAHRASAYSYREMEKALKTRSPVPISRALLHRIIVKRRPTSIDRATAISQLLGIPLADAFTHTNGDKIGGQR